MAALDSCAACGAAVSPETYQRRVLVVAEGRADAAFLEQLGLNRGVTDLQVTRPANGKDFTRKLEAMRGFAPESSTILVVADSDTSPTTAFKSIQRQIQAVGDYGVPAQPLEVSKAKGVPSIGVLTLPWVDRSGSLETLLLDAMSVGWPTVHAKVRDLLAATVPTSRGVSKDSKACLTCMVACVCGDDPSCAASAMWHASKGFQGLLSQECFDRVADFLKSL